MDSGCLQCRGSRKRRGRRTGKEAIPRAALPSPSRDRCSRQSRAAEDGAWVGRRQDRMELLHQPHRVPHPCMWKLPAFSPSPRDDPVCGCSCGSGAFFEGIFLEDGETGKMGRDGWDHEATRTGRQTDRRDRTASSGSGCPLSGPCLGPAGSLKRANSQLTAGWPPARLVFVLCGCVSCVSSPAVTQGKSRRRHESSIKMQRVFFAQILDEFNGGMRSDSSHRPDQRHTVRRAAGTSLGSILAIRLPATGSIRTAMQLPGSGTSTGRTRCRRGEER